jgi:hypothetical protein
LYISSIGEDPSSPLKIRQWWRYRKTLEKWLFVMVTISCAVALALVIAVIILEVECELLKVPKNSINLFPFSQSYETKKSNTSAQTRTS